MTEPFSAAQPAALLAPAAALGQTLGQATHERLRHMILQGELPVGAALHEKRIGALLGVSRTPVREAIARLQEEGLVTQDAGRTPLVRRLTVTEAVEILHLRRLVEVEAAGLAAAKGATPKLLALRKVFEGFLAGPLPDAAQHLSADDALHDQLAALAGSRLLAELIASLRRKTRIFDSRSLPERLHPGAAEHIAIIDAIAARDPERAKAAMSTHIAHVRASLLSHLENLS